MMNQSADIFLSYNREDQSIARRFADGFERAGFSVWWDQALKSGIDYDKATEQALRGAKAVVVLWSKQSVESRWVRTEATIALQSQTLVPVTIESCQRPIMFELTQTADLSHWSGDANDQVWLTFLHDVQQFVQSGAGAAATNSSLTRMTGAASKRRTSALAWSFCALFALTTAASTFIALQLAQQPPPPETRLELVTPATDNPVSFALSPDGKQIVFVASGNGESRLWLRQLSSTTAEPLAGTEGASTPFWSPDGKSVGFYADAMLKRLDLGSTPQNLVSVLNGQGGAWNADGTIIYAPSRTTPLMQIPAGGGEPTPLTTLGEFHQGHMAPHLLPDGQRYLFFVWGAPDIGGIYLGSLAGTPPVRLTGANSPGVYHPSGRLLWVSDGTLLSQRLDIDRATLTGEAIALAGGLIEDSNRSPLAVAAGGQIAYRTGTSTLLALAWFDRIGTRLGSLGDIDPGYSMLQLSPDGTRVAVTRSVQGNADIWVVDASRTNRLTTDGATEQYPVWSPDGLRLLFRSSRNSVGDLYEMTVASAGSERRVVASDQFMSPTDWSRDGRFALYLSIDPANSADLHVVTMDAEHKSALFLQTPFREVAAVFSPDGRWVAYHSNASGRMEVYVRPFTAPGDGAANNQWQVSTAGGIYPRWSEDGSELFFLDPDGAMVAVPIVATATTIEAGVPQILFATAVYAGGVDSQQGHQYDAAPDGRFLINTIVDDTDQPITLIQNWNPDAAQ